MRGYREGIGGPGEITIGFYRNKHLDAPPPPLEKSWAPTPTPLNVGPLLEPWKIIVFQKINHRTLGSVPSVKLLNKLKVRTKKTAKIAKQRCPSFLLSGGPGPSTPPPPPLGENSWIRTCRCRRNIIPH